MTVEDIDYYRMRVEQEHEAARIASDRYIAEIHMELAKAYEALIKHPELRSELRLAG